MAASVNLNQRLDRARLAAEIEAMTDGLTGLHNRRALDAAMARFARCDTPFAVLQMDLDRFKQVNDTLGHASGDHVLERVASILRAETRNDDLLLRTGGDEFVIICPELTDRLRLVGIARTLIANIAALRVVEAETIDIGASIGIALSDTPLRRSPTDILQRADVALYAAKRSGRGRFVFWSQELGNNFDGHGTCAIAQGNSQVS